MSAVFWLPRSIRVTSAPRGVTRDALVEEFCPVTSLLRLRTQQALRSRTPFGILVTASSEELMGNDRMAKGRKLTFPSGQSRLKVGRGAGDQPFPQIKHRVGIRVVFTKR